MWVLIDYFFSQQDTLYLIGVWLGEGQMIDTTNTHMFKRDYTMDLNMFNYSILDSDHNGGSMYPI